MQVFVIPIILKILTVSGELPSFYREPNVAPIFTPTVPASISNLYGEFALTLDILIS
jgi:hypothetical protein